jgi:hypothetical protein
LIKGFETVTINKDNKLNSLARSIKISINYHVSTNKKAHFVKRNGAAQALPDSEAAIHS